MAIQLKQQLKLSQQLVMTPQLQQAIKLLQLNQLELVAVVEQELQENPCLEEEEREVETAAELSDASPSEYESSEADSMSEGEAPPSEMDFTSEGPAETSIDGSDSADPTDMDKINDVDWAAYMESQPQTGLESRVGRDDDEHRSLEATLTSRPNLAQHLEWQIQLSDFDEEEVNISEWIVGNLDERGYLVGTVEDVADQAGLAPEEVERVLLKVQQLDPVGVAARDLRECLMIQLKRLRIDDPLVLSLVEEHLELLQKRDFRRLVKLLGTTESAIAAASRVIASLEPRPGRDFGSDEPVYITPDIYVHKVGEDFHVLLNEDGLPKLRISEAYKQVMTKDASESDESRETRDYVQDKVRSAMWIIKSIHQRQRTIYKVTESIIEHQREFFEKGVSHLKPLNLRDVADDIGMHESTVSRVTTNKYVHTPQGIYELKYFFNSSISRVGGEALASESVKERIRKIISSEDARRPVSDQRIVDMLKDADIDIARRTVTKYREAMRILSSTKRRQVG
ncbi:MAG: RNA polymerase sigma-54 factor [Deltaproteobacteria bacterium]|nr:RNA polymerase sigma-54 factor [Deltaproteobacteria bacterium]